MRENLAGLSLGDHIHRGPTIRTADTQGMGLLGFRQAQEKVEIHAMVSSAPALFCRSRGLIVFMVVAPFSG